MGRLGAGDVCQKLHQRDMTNFRMRQAYRDSRGHESWREADDVAEELAICESQGSSIRGSITEAANGNAGVVDLILLKHLGQVLVNELHIPAKAVPNCIPCAAAGLRGHDDRASLQAHP